MAAGVAGGFALAACSNSKPPAPGSTAAMAAAIVAAEAARPHSGRTVNATLTARLPEIWGEVTTACASDAKHYGVWDQNLMTEWHIRYGGRGVMIY